MAIGRLAPGPIVGEVLRRSTGKASLVHGEAHWLRVAAAGAMLCDKTPGADPEAVFLFALFHDAMRVSDFADPRHGARGALLFRNMRREGLVAASDARAGLLEEACERHTDGFTSSDPTIGVCWDADRLNLWRVGERPAEYLLSTAAAREPATIERCRRLQGEEPPSWGALEERYATIRRRSVEGGGAA